MHAYRRHAHQLYKRSPLVWCALALACLVLVQLLGLIHQTQHVPQRATASATQFAAKPALLVAFEQVATDHAVHHLHGEYAHAHAHGDVLDHDQGSFTCQLIDVAAGAFALLAAVVAAAACVALFAYPLAGGTAWRIQTSFALYCARAPPARLA
ncbi:hypothetical protein LN050_03750 [Comamonadaceae bacterium M7527]|nr:hypothetical protein LN050_03750 [Comamonadaceae bacterium M7527]